MTRRFFISILGLFSTNAFSAVVIFTSPAVINTMITESGDIMITEFGDIMVTE